MFFSFKCNYSFVLQYMSGTHITIWSMMMTGNGLVTPLNQISNVNKQFKRFESKDNSVDLTTPKLIFIALNLASLGVALYKMKAMGLLPVTAADWTGYLVQKSWEEYGAIPLV
jgi:hypothetical protein